MYYPDFVAAATEFVHNIVSIGACSNDECLNAYRHCLFTLPCLSQEGLPVSPPAPAVLEAAMAEEEFPVDVVGRQMCSSSSQLGVSLEKYMETLFTAALDQFGCGLETLIHSLWLVEQMQTKNILAHRKGAVALRDASGCLGDGVDDAGSIAAPWNPPPREELTPPIGKSGSTDGDTHFYPSAAPSDVLSVGPFSDTDDGAFCRACTEGGVFSLQFWNVQLYAAAALLLSMKLNEDAFAEADEEALANQVSSAVGCEPCLLRCAERCVCEILWDDLQVTERKQESVLRRFGMQPLCL